MSGVTEFTERAEDVFDSAEYVHQYVKIQESQYLPEKFGQVYTKKSATTVPKYRRRR